MRREPCILLVLLAACSSSSDESSEIADTRLVIDVQLSDTGLAMYAREPDRPCECSFGWTELGTCRVQSDAFSCACDPWPASCLEEVAVVDGDERLAASAWDASWWGVSLTLETVAGDQLLIAGCGTEVSVPLVGPSRPRADVTLDESGVVTWSSQPDAASSMVTRGDGHGGESCHREGGSGELEIAPEDRYVSVTPFAGPVEHDTELGAIRIWSGNGSQLTIE